MTYFLASGVGLLLGLIVDVVVGWPWWVVAFGFVVLVWVFFLSSVFRGPDNDLSHRLLRVINPDRAAERIRQRLEDALASGSLIGYEVASWVGDKSIGGWDGSPDPHSLTIRHGELDDQTAWIEVTSHTGDRANTAGEWVQEDLERRLVEARFPLPHDPTIEDFRLRLRSIQGADPPDWQPTSFRVDKELARAQIARAGSQWAAFLAAGSSFIEITGNRVDPDRVELDRISSLGDYPAAGA